MDEVTERDKDMTTNKSEYLFGKLARGKAISQECPIQAAIDRLQNDCWHKWDESNYTENSDTCNHCGEVRWVGNKDNPDFFSPGDKEWNNFGWLYWRAKEKTELNERMFGYIDCVKQGSKELSCTALATALIEWFEEEDAKNN